MKAGRIVARWTERQAIVAARQQLRVLGEDKALFGGH
jgi:hypothetical protein